MIFTPGRARGAAVVSALLLAAAFPPLNWWPLALVALVPLLVAVWSRSSKAVPALMDVTDAPGESVVEGHGGQGRDGLATGLETNRRPVFWPGFRLGWLFGFVFFTATLWWIQHVTLPGMLAMTVYLALYPAVAMGLVGWLRVSPAEARGVIVGKLLLLAGVWTGLEWVRSVALWGFPWNGLGVPLFALAGCRNLAASIGVTGLSSLVFAAPRSGAASDVLCGSDGWAETASDGFFQKQSRRGDPRSLRPIHEVLSGRQICRETVDHETAVPGSRRRESDRHG